MAVEYLLISVERLRIASFCLADSPSAKLTNNYSKRSSQRSVPQSKRFALLFIGFY